MNEPTAKRMFELLEQVHTSRSAATLATAHAKHRALRMPEGGDINKHLAEYEQILGEIRTLGGQISEEQLAWGALLSLPQSWKPTVNQIANRRQGAMTYQNIRADLLLEAEFNKAFETSTKSTEDGAKA
ncbi:unnamed protein product, partial [Rotaria magnacalcarata]